MTRTVYLHGYLGKIYGIKHKLDVSSVAEAVRAFCALYPNFKQNLKKGQFRISVGKKPFQTNEQLVMAYNGDYHITPVPQGAKSGWFQVFLGIVIIAVSIWNPMGWGLAAGATSGIWAAGVMMGASMVIGGVATLLTPVPSMSDYTQRERADERPSYLFNGPVNTMEQGGSIPLIYGRVITGSTVIAAELDVEDI